ncbi:hypothetical protein [Streptomyces griseus]|uniref:hypothetical protein n=1 Tax=Streptomyces griseus TaxID=1911 RepID=UPI00131B0BA8|nr:hypothetical protein [Streptomyces griseus]
MITTDLGSAKAKLQHAAKQLDDLKILIESVDSSSSFQAILRADLDSGSGYHIVRISEVPDCGQVIEDLSLGVGDIVNNLRCSLDHLAWQYACSRAQGVPRKPKDVYFLTCSATAGQQHKSPGFFAPEVWARMHEFQPCQGRNGRPDSWSGPYVHQLDLLTELSNGDKHQMLVHIGIQPNQFVMIQSRIGLPPWVSRTDSGIEFLPERINDPDPGADHLDFSHSPHLMEVGAEVVRILAPFWGNNAAIDKVGTAAPTFALPEGRPVAETLKRLVVFVGAVIEDLERACP